MRRHEVLHFLAWALKKIIIFLVFIAVLQFKFANNLPISIAKCRRDYFAMISLTRLNNTPLVINPDLIIFMEETPDTIITMANGEKIAVQEKVVEIIRRVIEFRRRVFNSSLPIE